MALTQKEKENNQYILNETAPVYNNPLQPDPLMATSEVVLACAMLITAPFFILSSVSTAKDLKFKELHQCRLPFFLLDILGLHVENTK